MVVGIDIGSRTVKTVFLRNGEIDDARVKPGGSDPYEVALSLLRHYPRCPVAATGYGRHGLKEGETKADLVITEIKAHALGARYLFPSCRTVIDVGGQDSKVIALDASGQFTNFQMNDKCAAGTGKFLEVMAQSLGYDMDTFSRVGLGEVEPVPINSMCTVFAESEVISLVSRRVDKAAIVRGLHEAMANRIASMANRVGVVKDVVFSGGVARNPTIVELLRKRLKADIKVPEAPDIVGALGAALAVEGLKRRRSQRLTRMSALDSLMSRDRDQRNRVVGKKILKRKVLYFSRAMSEGGKRDE